MATGRAEMRARAHGGLPLWVRTFSILVASLVLAVSGATSQLVSFAGGHHVVCEHGELIHVDPDDHVLAAPEQAPDLGVSARPGSAGRVGYSHVHCALAARARSASVVVAPMPSTTVAASPVVMAEVVATVGAERRAVWQFAPKTSPPASA